MRSGDRYAREKTAATSAASIFVEEIQRNCSNPWVKSSLFYNCRYRDFLPASPIIGVTLVTVPALARTRVGNHRDRASVARSFQPNGYDDDDQREFFSQG